MNVSRRLLVLLAAILLAGTLRAADAPNLPAISAAVQKFIEKNEVSGAVTLVATHDRIIHLGAQGLADIANGRPMANDSIFWIASMTKPVTAAAVLMLQDEGKVSVDDPVAKYIPELGQLKTPDGSPAVLTIRHILTHTSGMSEITEDEAKTAKTLGDLIPLYAAKPLKFTPGAKWVYCQSGINTAARIVEIVAGQSFPDFLEARFFKPLGMKDTTFYLSQSQLPRMAKSYKRTEDGKLEQVEAFFLMGKSPTSRDRYPLANGGLFSTAGDYIRFCQVLLNDGTLDGKSYLKPDSVKFMTSVLTGDLKTGFTDGNGWGLGVCVIRQPQGITATLSPGTYGHGGIYGTQAWIDPQKKEIHLLMVQRSNLANADGSELRKAFHQAAAMADTLR